MPNWVIYGLIAAVCFGITTVMFKAAQQKGNLSPYHVSFIFGLGIILLFGVLLIFNPIAKIEWKPSALALTAGIIWGIGMIAVAIAIAQKADVARLAPIYNINTLITVLLGIIFLHEIPDASHLFRVIAGAVLVVAGAVLVSI